jgi:hypothetical protein
VASTDRLRRKPIEADAGVDNSQEKSVQGNTNAATASGAVPSQRTSYAKSPIKATFIPGIGHGIGFGGINVSGSTSQQNPQRLSIPAAGGQTSTPSGDSQSGVPSSVPTNSDSAVPAAATTTTTTKPASAAPQYQRVSPVHSAIDDFSNTPLDGSATDHHPGGAHSAASSAANSASKADAISDGKNGPFPTNTTSTNNAAVPAAAVTKSNRIAITQAKSPSEYASTQANHLQVQANTSNTVIEANTSGGSNVTTPTNSGGIKMGFMGITPLSWGMNRGEELSGGYDHFCNIK